MKFLIAPTPRPERRSFDRVLVRRDARRPYVNRKGVRIDCLGICEANDIYIAAAGIGLSIFQHVPELRGEIVRRMEWEIFSRLAGPFAEAAYRGCRSKRGMRYVALFECGSQYDYQDAEATLADYRTVTAAPRHYGIGRFEDVARELVLAEWRAIDALARELLKFDMLEYGDAHAIVAPLLNASSNNVAELYKVGRSPSMRRLRARTQYQADLGDVSVAQLDQISLARPARRPQC